MSVKPIADLQPIQLIVGLGNPGTRYTATRHNAGFWFVDQLLQRLSQSFDSKEKFKAKFCKFKHADVTRLCLQPQTFMNNSGRAVLQCMQFYKVPPQAVLVVYDELDFAPGTVRFRQGGGHGGHNGMRDIISCVGAEFNRLRIGIGRCANADEVSDYVLSKPRQLDRVQIDQAIDQALAVMDPVWAGDLQAAMQALHQPPESNDNQEGN